MKRLYRLKDHFYIFKVVSMEPHDLHSSSCNSARHSIPARPGSLSSAAAFREPLAQPVWLALMRKVAITPSLDQFIASHGVREIQECRRAHGDASGALA